MAQDGEGENDPSLRVVIANGMDIDKQYFYEVTKQVSRDWDIRKISLLGPPLWAGLSLLFLFLAGRGLARSGLALIEGFWDGILRLLADPAAMLADNAFYFFVVTLVVVFIVKPLVDLLRFDLSFQSSVETFVGSLSNVRNVFTAEVWQNLNYWHPFTSNLGDRDPLILLGEETESDVSGVYADGPHYGNVFVDSVYVTVDGPEVGFQQRLLGALYDHQMRRVRRGVLVVVALTSGFWLLNRAVTADLLFLESVIPWTEVVAAVLLVGVAVLGLMYLSGHPSFHARFYADSAGLSRYNQLLDDPEIHKPTESDERLSLSNSMSGYGLFYVSEFLQTHYGDGRYDVSIDVDSLTAGEEDSFPAMGFTKQPNGSHAISAASELLWSAVPPASVRSSDQESDVTVELNGIDYLTIEDHSPDRLERFSQWAISQFETDSDDEDGPTQRRLTKRAVGERRGIRLPVKKFMSVPHDQSAAAVESSPDETPDLYVHDEWDEDERHYLLLGGGEHQQGINKLTLALKAEGYTNVDVLENAFSGTGQTDAANGNRVYDSTLFPTEYFVSFVGGDAEFFRQDDAGFLFFRHQLPVDGETRWIHVLIGMSAVGTKVGFLYWLDRFERGEEPFDGVEDGEEDVVHFVTHPGPTDFDGIDDIGHLYLDTSWREEGLTVEVTEDDTYENVEPTDDPDEKRLGMRYYTLDLHA
ncbi:hypothetical protein [Natronomonas sp.]|uniref:hypothetical protein n=1 Tax=Natronomonas sp. TaxID=2184060 RepID=UPI002FC3B268